MNMKKLFALMLALGISASLVACTEEDCRHVDANDDGKCDSCSADFEDGDEAVIPVKRGVKLTATDDKGNPLVGFTFTLTGAGETITFTTGADGSYTEQLYDGVNYSVELYRPEDESDATDVAYGFTLSTFSIKLEEGKNEAAISLLDNRPDGSKEKPFFIYEDAEINIAPGAEVYYSCRNAVDSWLEIGGADFVVSYNDKTITPDGGTLKLVFDASEGNNPSDVQFEVFSIKNNGDAALESKIEFKVRLGSYANPIPTESDSFTVSVSSTVYYQYNAAADGMLVVTSNNAKNNIKLTNDSVVSSYTMGAKGTYIPVKAGDAVKIEIFTTDGEPSDVDVALRVCQGTESDPLPVFTDEIDLKLDAGKSISCSVESGKKIKISNANVTVTTGGDTKEPNSLGMIIVNVSDDGVFTVTNTSTARNDVSIEIE